MLLGKPLRRAISRSGSASPDARNADSTRDECTTDLTRYGSRAVSVSLLITRSSRQSTRTAWLHGRIVGQISRVNKHWHDGLAVLQSETDWRDSLGRGESAPSRRRARATS